MNDWMRPLCVVSQPHRQLAKTSDPRTIEAAVLRRDRQSNQYRRLGFYTTITEFLDSVHLLGNPAEALLLEWPREIHQTNL